MNSFKKLKDGSQNIILGLPYFVLGLIQLVVWDTPKSLFINFRNHWRESKNFCSRAATLIAGSIVLGLFAYSLIGVSGDINFWIHRDQYEDVLFDQAEQQVREFFDKYNERWAAHDCDFMRKVGADEAMYDKYGNTEYPVDRYPNFCENFVNYQSQVIVPIKIGKLEENGDRYRIKGEMINIRRNDGEEPKIAVIYFELWKKLDWDLWHFNGKSGGPQLVDVELVNQFYPF